VRKGSEALKKKPGTYEVPGCRRFRAVSAKKGTTTGLNAVWGKGLERRGKNREGAKAWSPIQTGPKEKK